MSSQTELPIGRLKSRKLSPEAPIPEKLYFKIGEVSQLVGVRAHVLRYWEKEVPSIRPGKSASNQRRYRYRDVEIFREIRRLLHDERYTLAGARKRIMSGEKGARDGETDAAHLELLDGGADTGQGDGDDLELLNDDDVTLEAPAFARRKSEALQPRLPLGHAGALPHERLERVRQGLRDLIRLVGEEP